MNETLKTIMERRSIKGGYLPKKVSDEDLQTILDAAILAPNGLNQQKWHFTVVQNPAMLDKILETIKQNMLKDSNPVMVERARKPDFNPLYGASTLIIITYDESAPVKEVTCGAAAENIVLAAASLGIGSCMIGGVRAVFNGPDAPAMKKELGIPENYAFVISVILGYSEMKPDTPARNRDVFNYIR